MQRLPIQTGWYEMARKEIVNISRKFLNTNGVLQSVEVEVEEPKNGNDGITPNITANLDADVKTAWINNLQRLNVCSQKGLVEMFDSTIGAGTVLMPFGGKYQLTPAEGMCAKIPVEKGETVTGTLCISFQSLYLKTESVHGAINVFVESVAKIVCMAATIKKQINSAGVFEKPGKIRDKWGKPFSALMGAFYAQMNLKIPRHWRKRQHVGNIVKDLNVPPTLVSFAVNTADVTKVFISGVQKSPKSCRAGEAEKRFPQSFRILTTCINIHKIYELVLKQENPVGFGLKAGGVSEAISKILSETA